MCLIIRSQRVTLCANPHHHHHHSMRRWRCRVRVRVFVYAFNQYIAQHSKPEPNDVDFSEQKKQTKQQNSPDLAQHQRLQLRLQEKLAHLGANDEALSIGLQGPELLHVFGALARCDHPRIDGRIHGDGRAAARCGDGDGDADRCGSGANGKPEPGASLLAASQLNCGRHRRAQFCDGMRYGTLPCLALMRGLRVCVCVISTDTRTHADTNGCARLRLRVKNRFLSIHPPTKLRVSGSDLRYSARFCFWLCWWS